MILKKDQNFLSYCLAEVTLPPWANDSEITIHAEVGYGSKYRSIYSVEPYKIVVDGQPTDRAWIYVNQTQTERIELRIGHATFDHQFGQLDNCLEWHNGSKDHGSFF